MLNQILKRKEPELRRTKAYKLSWEKNLGIDVCFDGRTNFEGEDYYRLGNRINKTSIRLMEIPKKDVDIEGKIIKLIINSDTRIYTILYSKNTEVFKGDKSIYQRLNRNLKIAKFLERLF